MLLVVQTFGKGQQAYEYSDCLTQHELSWRAEIAHLPDIAYTMQSLLPCDALSLLDAAIQQVAGKKRISYTCLLAYTRSHSVRVVQVHSANGTKLR